MPLVSACPKCEAAVLLPDGVGPTAKAKCPLCEEQFELSEMFSNLPPLLEIVDQPNRPAPLVVAAATGEGGASVADESEDGLVEFGSGVFGSIHADAEGEAAGDTALDLEPVDESADAGDSGSGFGSIDFGGMSGDEAEGDRTEAEGGFLDTATSSAPVSLASKARPKKKGPGPLFFGAGIAGFGILGLLIGYGILLMIKGSAGDIAGIGKYYPSFIYAGDGNDKSNGQRDESSNNNKSNNRSSNKSSRNSNDNSNENGNGQLNSLNTGDGKIAEVPFPFDDPSDKKDPKDKKNPKDDKRPEDRKNPKNGGEKIAEPRDQIGPTKLKQTLMADIEIALDEVAVKAASLAATRAMAEQDPDNGETEKNLRTAVNQHYYALGALGLTIASSKPGSLKNEELKERIKQYLDNAVTKVDTFDEIGRKAAIWIDYKDRVVLDDDGNEVLDDEGNVVKKGRLGRDGILIAGRIRKVGFGDKAGVFTAKVEIAGSEKTVTIVGSGNPPNAGGHLLLLGAIVENPAENLAGYTGDEDSVVWLGMAVDAPKEDELIIEEPEIVDDEVEFDEPKDTEEPDIELQDFE